MLALLFVPASQRKTSSYGSAFSETLTRLLRIYSGELGTEAGGALGKWAAALIDNQAWLISNQIANKYTCVSDIDYNDDAEDWITRKERRAQRV